MQKNDGGPRIARRAVLAVAVLPVAFGVVDVAQDAIFGQASGVRLSARMIPGILVFYLVLSLLTPGVLRIVRFANDERRGRLGMLATHLAGAPLFALTHLALTMLVQRGVIPHEPDIGRHFANMTRMFFIPSLMWYVVLAVSLHALLYYARSRDSELTAARLAAGLAEARMSLLGSQLAPHFLFNTLSTIEALAERGDTRKVTAVVHDLSDLLREVRPDGLGSTTSVNLEVALLEKYLRILRVRFGDGLIAAVRVDPAVSDAEVPVMTLQTLVENAVKHGYRARAAALRVDVDVRRAGDLVLLRVADSGPGFSNARPTALPGGVGLSNLRARLAALYGEASDVEIGDSDLGGAEIVVRFPYRTWSAL